MKIEHTSDSPILLRLVPESPMDAFNNGVMSAAFENMNIRHKVGDDATLLINIDPDGWKDFAEHTEDQ